MDREGWKGSITVFLSITCILFLSLICAAVESARRQGARTQSANITGVGGFSLLSEYENTLLEKYNILALDSTYGSGNFKRKKAEEKLEGYLSANVNPGKNFLAGLCTDPWRLTLKDCEIEKYQLLTDQQGEAFYQQAVDYMKVNAGTAVISQLLEYYKKAEDVQKYQEKYEEDQKSNETYIEELEGQKQQKLEELQEKEEGQAQEYIPEQILEEPSGNPLKEIRKLRKKSVLNIVTGDKKISQKKISRKELPSRKITQKGNYKLTTEHNGLIADVLFREYLLTFFPNYLSEEKGKGLDYQLEYLIGGESSDKANLKKVANRLLLLREGMNYLHCLEDAQLNTEAEHIAVFFTGFLGIPAITAATQHALLLAWAYGESLIDVRILLDGGKIPINKQASDWKLSMENLGKITELLQKGNMGSDNGLSYRGYLRILLNLGNCRKQRLRALDMIQTELQAQKETANFKVENCMTAVGIQAQWECRGMFCSVPEVFLGIGTQYPVFTQKSSISY